MNLCRASVLLSFSFIAVLAAASPSLTAAWVQLKLNGREIGEPTLVWMDGHDVMIPFETLYAMRLDIPASLIRDHKGHKVVSLSALPEVSWLLEPTQQMLNLTATGRAFRTTRIQPGRTESPEITPLMPGGYVNYDITGRGGTNLTSSTSGLLELGAFAGTSLANTSAIARDHGGHKGLTRLETALQLDLHDRLMRVSVGDGVTRPGDGGSVVRFGGVKVERRFSLRPDLVTFPLPAVSGVSELPSTADLYINNALIHSDQLREGPFEFQEIPMILGSGDIRLEITDIAGRQRTLVLPYIRTTPSSGAA